MITPATLMKAKGAFGKFKKGHPKAIAFFKKAFGSGMKEGTVMEVTITPPGGKPSVMNLKITKDDLELFEVVKALT